VTAGSRGIGPGIAGALASQGVSVAVGARQFKGAANTAEALEAAYGVRCFAVQLDVRNDDSLNQALNHIEEQSPGRLSSLMQR
jgi:NAD(P)-dependent dehydrogenase (short-subunit alcohol dehydrogenase family)